MKEFICRPDYPVADTLKGKIRGYKYDGVFIFRGIRYAEAERFCMPKPVKAWKGIKDATNYGLNCPVLNEPVPESEIIIPHRFWPVSEHCQYLNIWTPALDPGAKKAVMFWMHGGGYFAGSAIEQECYDGTNLAKLDDIVFVSINHRLNVFGHLDLSDFGEEYWNTANLGIADIVEALHWVKENIAAFGGDPDNVTIFGQSGGGGKATILNQIPEADGLFAKSIIMSGVIPEHCFDTGCSSEELVLKIMEFLRIKDRSVKKLAKVPVPQLVWAVNKATVFFAKRGISVNWTPKPNRYYLCDPLAGDFTAHSLTVPTMVGTVFSEFSSSPGLKNTGGSDVKDRAADLQKMFGKEGSKALLEAFAKVYPDMDPVYLCDIDRMFLPDTVRYVKKKAAEASAPVYNYMFAKVFDFDGGRAAWHCADIPFFLHNAGMIPVCHQKNWEYLEKVMSGAFVNFAKTGDPNTEGLPKWEPCTGDRMVTMVFDDECVSRENMQDKLLPLVLKYSPPVELPASELPDDDSSTAGRAWVF